MRFPLPPPASLDDAFRTSDPEQFATISAMSDQSPQIDPILTRFRAALDETYGPRLERVMLYGSRTRGDAREDSDYDVAVFLRDMT
jgi:hypothetical protein